VVCIDVAATFGRLRRIFNNVVLLLSNRRRYAGKYKVQNMRLIMRSVLFSMLTVAICGAQHTPHSYGSGGFHGSGSGIHYTGSGVHFANPGFGQVNSLPPPASGITAEAWNQIQRSNRFAHSQVPWGGFSAPYYYPSFGYGDSAYVSNRYDGPPPPDPRVQSMGMAESALSQQIQMLSDQIDQLKNAQQRGAPPQDEAVQQTTPQVPITLVLRNGQQIQVQNYAVMGQIFWDFTTQPARKIPVSSIDISASTRATEATGAEFPQLNGTR
jgi:hypothetical protein